MLNVFAILFLGIYTLDAKLVAGVLGLVHQEDDLRKGDRALVHQDTELEGVEDTKTERKCMVSCIF